MRKKTKRKVSRAKKKVVRKAKSGFFLLILLFVVLGGVGYLALRGGTSDGSGLLEGSTEIPMITIVKRR